MISELFTDKRLFVFAGNFGSGKTEISINFALDLVKAGRKTVIADMDIVNPFFRTADAKGMLEQSGVRVITPVYAGTNVDVPALPGEIYSIFQNRGYSAVFDVGGDDLGAKAISRYREEFISDSTIMFFVVNLNRPMTNTAEKIEQTFHEIENSARIKFDAIVSNTNLLADTTDADISRGVELMEKVSVRLGVKTAFCVRMGHRADSDSNARASSDSNASTLAAQGDGGHRSESDFVTSTPADNRGNRHIPLIYIHGVPIFEIDRYITMGYQF
ncbi:MAG: hypothetical protein FWH55_12425 [Oscillospiraceae bacterium]|nr:hypothetical protein [Oscillospiraceae bacterium]